MWDRAGENGLDHQPSTCAKNEQWTNIGYTSVHKTRLKHLKALRTSIYSSYPQAFIYLMFYDRGLSRVVAQWRQIGRFWGHHKFTTTAK